MVTGVACGLQNRYGAFARPGWVRFPHVPAIFACAAALAAAPPHLIGQTPEEPAPADAAAADTVAAAADTVPPISPLGALARSMVIPGWGQVEVGRPSRGAIYFGTASAAVYMVFKSNAKLNAARSADPENVDLVEARTRQRENWIVLAGFIAFLSGLDAWVSTHFWDFEPSLEAPEDGTAGFSVGVRIGVP